MKNNKCAHCQYFHPAKKAGMFTAGTWCSNSKSPRGAGYVDSDDTCGKFAKRGKKTPLLMRARVKVNTWLKKKSK